ncbi:hypothetical protein EMIHUDRAFT_363254 [Emiliania huxleyi CCMP1516]|uniref:Uncharacterized protein n=2 Tax=Emiliania huxleyi TaxID=2903 RepID=A0A0D3KGC9_EMIH1|nr:hypothetical protein EMIHUDRAFT_363254 [Emiliania huxleyi CCMP1516]EOD34814.1 hypothetical protein EMIHUDRAFT_363254 [Emiliania huxleyi CCMP1516]|eukprot:XP_005787243.1 hypothetical protein EMIHUDRAFT_363254 [Emiliania huxleyi CCMP1516]
MWASRPAAAARPVEAGLGPARDGWPPTSALALLVKMAAVSIAATVVQSLSAQASVVCRLLSQFAHARAPRGHEPSAIRSRSQKLLARTAADSTIAAAAVELSRRLVPDMLPPCGCCRRAWRSADYKEVLTRFLLEFFYPHDSERECDRTIGSFGHQSEITREQLSLPLASPPSPPGTRHSWHPMGRPEYRPLAHEVQSDRHLAGLSARPPDRVELIGAGSLGYGTGPSFG